MKRFYLVNLLPNAAVAASMIFIPIIAQNLGLSLFELGLVGSAYSLGSFISYYIFGRWSDKIGNRSHFIKAGLFILALTVLLQVLMNSFVSMLLIRFAVGFAIGIFTFPLVAAVCEFNHMKKKLAMLTAFGSLGWFVGQIMAAFLADFNSIFIASAFFCIAATVVSLRIPDTTVQKCKMSLFPTELIKKNSRLYTAVFLRHVGAWSIWIILPLYMQQLGASLFWIGIIYAFNPLTQFFAMRYVGKLSSRIHETTIIKIGLGFAALTFISYSFATSFWHLIPSQIMLGISWAFMYTGALIHLASKNIEKATSTGLLGSTTRLSMIIGPIIGGSIAFMFGFTAPMYFAFATTLIGIFIARKL
tara:strand:- start:805 stop:1884 length:1080 start_codon:yes stop_codon:yes gene_type:complete